MPALCLHVTPIPMGRPDGQMLLTLWVEESFPFESQVMEQGRESANPVLAPVTAGLPLSLVEHRKF